MNGKAKSLALPDGTLIREGDFVRARGETSRLQTCVVLGIDRGAALLTAGLKYTGRRSNFGTVVRKAKEIMGLLCEPCRRGLHWECELGSCQCKYRISDSEFHAVMNARNHVLAEDIRQYLHHCGSDVAKMAMLQIGPANVTELIAQALAMHELKNPGTTKGPHT